MPMTKVYLGTIIDTPKLGELRVIEHAAVFVNKKGVITRIMDISDKSFSEGRTAVMRETLSSEEAGIEIVDQDWMEDDEGNVVRKFWFPGFVDTHTHPSQHPNAGIFGKSTLLDWLNTYTFPLESSLSSPAKSRAVYTSFLTTSLRSGTTTASYYATSSTISTNTLATLCHARGQRAFIGRTNMDTDLQPPYYRDASASSALAATAATIAHIKSLDPTYDLIKPIITPRFAPSCSEELLAGLGSLAEKEDLPIQTHISENLDEVALVQRLFPGKGAGTYAGVYDHYGLLGPKTVLAHAVHLSPRSANSCAKEARRSPTVPGLCPVRALLDDGIEVGLGTDVSGGFSGSMLSAAREAGIVSRVLAGVEARGASIEGEAVGEGKAKQREKSDRVKLSPEECLYLATRGGATCLGLGDKVGAFEVGMEWDAQLIGLNEMRWEEQQAATTMSGVEPSNETDEERMKRLAKEIREEVEGGGGDGDGGREVVDGSEGLVELWGKETWSERIAKWVFCGDDRNTRRVYVRGDMVHSLDG
ncbi:uncharacterized protein KY384_005639 [Bacidia gigantensis]|uniref:uncharacterized protein n=1 Tax=Bacidia gigantensis TaxID=2732470 RepID=UPI001D04E793|nr:uncharacterized protein KY384_005639 [Bacidia gigantensis]KAG8530156.1 hypothetical protein KY384_005639 [Bacidia gigantensis]